MARLDFCTVDFFEEYSPNDCYDIPMSVESDVETFIKRVRREEILKRHDVKKPLKDSDELEKSFMEDFRC